MRHVRQDCKGDRRGARARGHRRAPALAQQGLGRAVPEAVQGGARRQDGGLRSGRDELRPHRRLVRRPEEGARAVRREVRDPRSQLEHQCRRAGGDLADLGEAGRDGDPQSRRADLRQAAATRRERRHLRDPDQHGLGLSPLGLRRRQLDRDRREGTPKAWSKACQGKSNKIAIMQGALSAAASAYTLKGVENVLAKHPEIKVVSSQAADWDAAKAKAITQTVLKQNPDLCGIVGFWDGMDIGTAAAIKEAGLTGKVFVATSGGGERKGACELVKTGSFDLNLSYDVPTQAAQMAGTIKWLLSSGAKAGSVKGSEYTTLIPITKENADSQTSCWNLSDLKK